MDIIADASRISTHNRLVDIAKKARDRLSAIPCYEEDEDLVRKLYNSIRFPEAWRPLRDDVRKAQKRFVALGEGKLANEIGNALFAFDVAWAVKLQPGDDGGQNGKEQSRDE